MLGLTGEIFLMGWFLGCLLFDLKVFEWWGKIIKFEDLTERSFCLLQVTIREGKVHEKRRVGVDFASSLGLCKSVHSASCEKRSFVHFFFHDFPNDLGDKLFIA